MSSLHWMLTGRLPLHVLAFGFASFSFYLAQKNCLPWPLKVAEFPDSHANRLTFAIRSLAISMLPLIIGISSVGTQRYLNDNLAKDPTVAVPASMKRFKIWERYLLNTVEQTILHVVVVLVLSTLIWQERLFVITFMVWLFVNGRAFYLVGYLFDPQYRGLGFALSYLPSLAGFAYSLWQIYTKGLSEAL